MYSLELLENGEYFIQSLSNRTLFGCKGVILWEADKSVLESIINNQ